ncbi:NAD(P)-binding protein [Pseudarthrobacter oxydans]|uniref:NAD(P)-binding protein n=1 Tax=Pseudarthrobacter oxydans TaxID=1671 RepID=UPI003D29958C
MEPTKALPVAVIGAGPVGLAAAAHLLERGLEPLLFEAGPTAGTAIASGLPALGEDAAKDRISEPLPDVTGRDRAEFAGRRVLVVGAGHSAANTLISLAGLAKDEPDTRIFWVVRGASAEKVYGGGDADGLPARGQLGARVRRLVEAGRIELQTGFGIAALKDTHSGVSVHAVDGRVVEADVVVPCTGFRPDLDILHELRLDLDPAVEAPVRLGPLIDPEFHSCGTVPPHGAKLLAHPDKHFYIVGMKSYGRAPTFLLATGYEQVRSVVAALAGDREAADAVQLELPETGVCSTDAGSSCDVPAPATGGSDGEGACCAAPEPVLSHGRSASN